MVIWLVGMSGAGKTTIGQALYASLKAQRPQTVFVDGDEIRALFRHDQQADAYSVAGRRVNAERIQALCGWLDGQGIDVVCCILSMFQDISDDNRQRDTLVGACLCRSAHHSQTSSGGEREL